MYEIRTGITYFLGCGHRHEYLYRVKNIPTHAKYTLWRNTNGQNAKKFPCNYWLLRVYSVTVCTIKTWIKISCHIEEILFGVVGISFHFSCKCVRHFISKSECTGIINAGSYFVDKNICPIEHWDDNWPGNEGLFANHYLHFFTLCQQVNDNANFFKFRYRDCQLLILPITVLDKKKSINAFCYVRTNLSWFISDHHHDTTMAFYLMANFFPSGISSTHALQHCCRQMGSKFRELLLQSARHKSVQNVLETWNVRLWSFIFYCGDHISATIGSNGRYTVGGNVKFEKYYLFNVALYVVHTHTHVCMCIAYIGMCIVYIQFFYAIFMQWNVVIIIVKIFFVPFHSSLPPSTPNPTSRTNILYLLCSARVPEALTTTDEVTLLLRPELPHDKKILLNI